MVWSEISSICHASVPNLSTLAARHGGGCVSVRSTCSCKTPLVRVHAPFTCTNAASCASRGRLCSCAKLCSHNWSFARGHRLLPLKHPLPAQVELCTWAQGLIARTSGVLQPYLPITRTAQCWTGCSPVVDQGLGNPLLWYPALYLCPQLPDIHWYPGPVPMFQRHGLWQRRYTS